MENNEQNKVAEPVTETTNTIMVSEPNNVETPVVEAPVVETSTEEPTQSVTPEPVVIPKGEKPKKNNSIVILLLIIILILLGVCGYFVYDKYFSNRASILNANEQTNDTADGSNDNINDANDNNQLSNNANNDNLNNKGVVLTDTEAKEFVNDLVDKYYGEFDRDMVYIFGKLDDELKVGMAINKLAQAFTTINSSALVEANGRTVDFRLCGAPAAADLDLRSIKVEDVKAKYKELFNEDMPDVEYPIGADMGYNYARFKYYDGLYYVYGGACGGPYVRAYPKYVVSNYNFGDLLEVTVDLKMSDKLLAEFPDWDAACYPSNEKKTTCSYKLTFKNVDGKYILVSSEEI